MSPHAATVAYLRHKVRLFVQEQEKNKVNLRMEIVAVLNDWLEQDITKGLLGEPTDCKTAVSQTVASITIKEQQILATKIPCKELKERHSTCNNK